MKDLLKEAIFYILPKMLCSEGKSPSILFCWDLIWFTIGSAYWLYPNYTSPCVYTRLLILITNSCVWYTLGWQYQIYSSQRLRDIAIVSSFSYEQRKVSFTICNRINLIQLHTSSSQAESTNTVLELTRLEVVEVSSILFFLGGGDSCNSPAVCAQTSI